MRLHGYEMDDIDSKMQIDVALRLRTSTYTSCFAHFYLALLILGKLFHLHTQCHNLKYYHVIILSRVLIALHISIPINIRWRVANLYLCASIFFLDDTREENLQT